MLKDMAKEIIDAIQSLVFGRGPQGFFLLPSASRQCADIPIAKKYSNTIKINLSRLNSNESEPQMVNDITIPV